MKRPKVILIEDDELTRRQMELALRSEFDLLATGDPSTGLRLAHEGQPTLVLLDLGLPPNPTDPEQGFRCLREIAACGGQPKVIVCTGHGERKHAVRAIQQGAEDFFTKPVDLDLLKCLMRRACWVAELEREEATLLPEPAKGIEELTGASDSIRRVIAAIRKVAPTEVPVLLTGESGTGKERAALAIHARSRRKDGPFVPINCGAIPETLLESELFGHEKGAFTGACHQKKGKLESAQGGTLFLDEVGELPYFLQVKLLRFLQDQILERIGGTRPIQVDTRVLAATNRDLREAIAQGEFREDLYYRLGVVAIQLPPLRDRGEDVLLLAQEFLRVARTHQGRRVRGFTREAIQALRAHPWPGNVRELGNRIHRAVVMAEGPHLTPEDLELSSPVGEAAPLPVLKDARQRADAAHAIEALTLHGWNVRRTAEALGVSRPTLYTLLRRRGIQARAHRQNETTREKCQGS